MCADFRDLNEPYPQGHYPFVTHRSAHDSIAGYALLSMMDDS